MKIIASYNVKGGVGKTATVVNLAYLCANAGNNTLVWDLDPQGASSYYFRIKPKIKGGTEKIMQTKKGIYEVIKGTDFENLDLLPADFSYRNMDLSLHEKKNSVKQFKKILAPLSKEYDYVFLDCAPNISLVSENIFKVASALLIPVIPTVLSVRMLEQILKFTKENQFHTAQMLPFFSMVDRRKKMHKETMQEIPQKYSFFLKNFIPYSSDIEKMGIERAPIAYFLPQKSSSIAYRKLWKEIQEAL